MKKTLGWLTLPVMLALFSLPAAANVTVPEPATLGLMGLGIAAASVFRRRK